MSLPYFPEIYMERLFAGFLISVDFGCGTIKTFP